MWLPVKNFVMENNINFFIQSKSLKHIKLIYLLMRPENNTLLVYILFINIPDLLSITFDINAEYTNINLVLSERRHN